MNDHDDFAEHSPVRPYLLEDPEGNAVVVLERILPYLLNRTTFQLNQLLKVDLKPHGLSISNWRVLAVVATNESVTMNQIATYAMIEQPTASRMVDRLEAAEANQYRIFRFDEAGAIRAAFVFLRMDAELAAVPADVLALGQVVQTILLWSDRAFTDRSALGQLADGRVVLRPDIGALIRAAYDPVLPAMSRDPAHALRLAARLQAPS